MENVANGVQAWNLGPGTRHALVTTAIGERYLSNFTQYSLPYWKIYAETFDLAIIVISDETAFDGRDGGLNGAWLKLLAPLLVAKVTPQIQRVALIDSDVIVNPAAPNIFAACEDNRIGVVSQFNNLPFDLLTARKRLAFLRKSFYNSNYPLDSSLFATAQQEYQMENLPERDDLFCSGVIVLPQDKALLFDEWFREALDRDAESAIAWEQTFVNHKILDHDPQWLPYKFQGIWNLEMAIHHPSLFGEKDLADNPSAQAAVADTLSNCFFLHFAGSWNESDAWRNEPSATIAKLMGLASPQFIRYLGEAPSGAPAGRILRDGNQE